MAENEPRCQSVNPNEGDKRPKSTQVREMFDNIAPAYDLMNRLMSLGIDRRWRRRLVKAVGAARPKEILDIACGTADLAMLLATLPGVEAVTGLDLSEEMIKVGRRKVLAAELGDTVTLVQGDSLRLPFANDTFDCVTVAYGVRNFEDLLRGYREMHRVLRPGGMLAVLELSTPTSPAILPAYNLYAGTLIPALGRLVSGDGRAYEYLPKSIAAVPQGQQMLSILSGAGFEKTAFQPMTFGTCTLYSAYKPLVES